MMSQFDFPQITNGKRRTALFIAFLVVLFLMVFLWISGPAQAMLGISHSPEQDLIVYNPLIIGSPQPATSYEDNFNDTIEPWAARRWSADAEYEIEHNDDCDDGHCGFLELKVNNSAAYVIVSPLAAVEAPFTYSVSTRAKLLNRDDGDEYGIIFGGNRTGNECPGPMFSTCFTEYYEFRVRYNDDNGDQYLDWKLKKVEGHDENNQNFGPDIIDWKRLDGVAADSWVKWDIEVHNNGQMHIFANGSEQAGSAQDSTYIHNHYFGLMGRTSDHGGSHVIFDMMEIK